jgi:hypothetical protein
LKIAIFHYHLHPGGVTTVIRYSAAAAAQYISEIEEIVLVSGDREHTDSVRAAVSALIPSSGKCSLSAAILPAIGYVDENEAANIDLPALKRTLLQQFGGYFWWVHNYHIGKNPLFTRAVIEIAQEHPEQAVFFHIHDFPECARFNNLEFLRRYYTETLYPKGKNILYGAINSRDYKLLLDAGLPGGNVFYLPNPKPPEPAMELSSRPAQEEIDRSYADKQSYISGAPILLYPVRSIRRKNVLEAGLLSKLSSKPANLFITLPGTSDHEKNYSRLVEKAYRNGLIPGVFGAGMQSMEEKTGIGFHDLLAASECIVSASIQEGFGYLFIQAISWEKKLFAKSLETLSDFTPYFSDRSHCMYGGLFVPLRRKEIQSVKERYDEYLSGLVQFLGEEGIRSLKTRINGMFDENPMDYSFLPPDIQYDVLLRCKQGEYLKECRHINENVLEQLETLLDSPDGSRDIDLDAQFGFEAYARRVEAMFSAPAAEPPAVSDGKFETDREIQQYFLGPEYIRLLYAPYPP